MLRAALTFVVLTALVAPAGAQTQAEANKLSAFLDTERSAIDQSGEHILGMASSLPDTELVSVLAANDMISSASAVLGMTGTLAHIYSVMVHPQDAATVKRFATIQARHAVNMANLAVRRSNEVLVQLRAPAIISEFQKARDALVKARDEIQRVIPTSGTR